MDVYGRYIVNHDISIIHGGVINQLVYLFGCASHESSVNMSAISISADLLSISGLCHGYLLTTYDSSIGLFEGNMYETIQWVVTKSCTS